MQSRFGVPADLGESGEDRLDLVRTRFDWQEEVQSRGEATLSVGPMICVTDTIQKSRGAWTVRARPLKYEKAMRVQP